MHKRVGNRMMEKRIHVRIEHVRPSKCRDDFLQRVRDNAAVRAQAKAEGRVVSVKRRPAGPIPAHTVDAADNVPVLVTPLRYEELL